MITIEQFESGEVQLTDEWFVAIYGEIDWYGLPQKEVIGYKGTQTGTLLSPEFSEILE